MAVVFLTTVEEKWLYLQKSLFMTIIKSLNVTIGLICVCNIPQSRLNPFFGCFFISCAKINQVIQNQTKHFQITLIKNLICSGSNYFLRCLLSVGDCSALQLKRDSNTERAGQVDDMALKLPFADCLYAKIFFNSKSPPTFTAKTVLSVKKVC